MARLVLVPAWSWATAWMLMLESMLGANRDVSSRFGICFRAAGESRTTSAACGMDGNRILERVIGVSQCPADCGSFRVQRGNPRLMSPYIAAAVGGLIAYVAGALPFGKWVAAARGVDILKEGSGNIGATNVWRTLGAGFGSLVLLLDISKGFLPAFLLPLLAGRAFGDPNWGLAFGACAVFGHSASPFLGFRGGKSVATALGVMLAVSPDVAGISFGLFLLVLAVTRYVSLGSIVGAIAAPISAGVLGYPVQVVIVYSVLAVLIVWRHRPNIERLMKGTESKFGEKKND
jgi:glycerol-3-phosphate acyltransferase PlsY